MKDLINRLFGEYVPVMTQEAVTVTIDGVSSVEYIDTVASGVAGVDWVWIAGVFLFGIVLFCALRIVGVLIKR